MNTRVSRNFIDAQKISKHLYCSICHEVFDNPTRMRCGHTFCYGCMLDWRKMSKNCPECKTKHVNWHPEKDLVAAHIVDDLEVKCSFNKCEWTGLYQVLKKHLRFCVHREKRQFEDVGDEEVVKVEDENDESQIEIIKTKGKKKLKKNEGENGLPQFSQSSSSESSLYMQPLQPNRQPASQPNPSQNINSQDHSIGNLSSRSSGYLETNLRKLIKNQKNQKPRSYPEQNPEKKEKEAISRQMDEISFDDENSKRLYPILDEEKQKQQVYHNNDYEQRNRSQNEQEFFRILDQRNEEPENLYTFRRFLQEEQRTKRQREQKEQSAPKWGTVHPASKGSDSSDMSNPFQEPIPETKQKCPRNKKGTTYREVIILESSDESQMVNQKQSGEISEMLYVCKDQTFKHNSILTQIPDPADSTIERRVNQGKDKKKASTQKINKSEKLAMKQASERTFKRKRSRSRSLEY